MADEFGARNHHIGAGVAAHGVERNGNRACHREVGPSAHIRGFAKVFRKPAGTIDARRLEANEKMTSLTQRFRGLAAGKHRKG